MPASLLRFTAIILITLLGGCMSRGIPPADGQFEALAARELLVKSANAHGLPAFLTLQDISVSYSGEWYGLVSRIQPGLIDPGFRQGSQERIILKGQPVVAQRHEGPQGSKQVIRTADKISVFYNGEASLDKESQAAAALVADAYRLFLTGPFYFLDNNLSLQMAPDEEVDGRTCQSIVAVRRPGHGLSDEDRYQLFIDGENHLLRRVRFTMEGLDSTKGAIAEVDFFDHQTIAGVTWPTRFFERLRKPIPGLPVHDWRLTGVDVNRGLSATELSGKAFSGKAETPARRITAP